jgi:malonate transporter and related proteins
MWAISLAILPIFLLLVLGNLLRRNGFPGGEFWYQADRVTYWVLFPALLLHSTTTAPFNEDIVDTYALALLSALFVTGIISLLCVKAFKFSGPHAGSVFQGASRHNTFIAVAIAEYLYGAQGLLLATVAISILVPMTNLLCVTVLVWFQGTSGTVPLKRRLLQEIMRNPLLIAIVIGLSLNISGIGPLPVLHDFTGILSKATLPIALLCVGAGLRIKSIHTGAKFVAISSLCKMLVFPTVIIAAVLMMDVTGVAAMVLIIYGVVPTASSGYALAKLLGGDAEVMAGIITVQTLISIFTLPLALTIATRYFLS